ncbi:MAG TPA: hypothetical protein VJ528_07350 [Geothrix sp.]|nr:hypothetical protein [Geothrix sp.]
MAYTTSDLVSAVLAIGALGTAAFGLVDASKAFWGGVSNAGFGFISSFLDEVVPKNGKPPAEVALTLEAMRDTLRASWLNGAPLADQKSAAKSLVKLQLNAETAADLAKTMGVDATVMVAVATRLQTAHPLEPEQQNVYGRFDLVLATRIDRAYQCADQRYRNTSKVAACAVAVILAEVAAWSLQAPPPAPQGGALYLRALIAGLLATPLAPVAKDLASAISTAAKAVQAIKGRA